LSHAEIKARLESSGADIDRVTLYRILDSLLAAGIVRKAVDSRGVLRFSVAARRTPHDGHAHFRCEDCGGVFCVDAPLPVAPSLPDGFHLHGAELDLHGICARCGDAGEGHPA
jgi:Fur family ferric uptake transcriptional regulator